MKNVVKVILVSLVLVSSMNVNAQTPKYDKAKQEILVDGKYYAKLVKTNFNAIGLIKNYSIQNKDGEELMFFKYSPYRVWDARNHRYADKAAYEITFINGKGKVYIKKQFIVNSVMKLVTKNNLVVNDKIDPEAEERFISVYNGRQGSNKEVVVETSDIVLSDNKVMKEGEVIGKYVTKTKTDEAGVSQTVVNVYSTKGEKIATAKAPIENASEWSVFTISDGKTTDVLYESSSPEEKLISWMVSAKYFN